MIEICAGKTEGAAIAGKKDHRAPAEILPTFVAARLPVRNEDTQIVRATIAGRAFGGH